MKKTPQDFADAYGKLCKKMGYVIAATPKFILQKDNSYAVTINLSVAELTQDK